MSLSQQIFNDNIVASQSTLLIRQATHKPLLQRIRDRLPLIYKVLTELALGIALVIMYSIHWQSIGQCSNIKSIHPILSMAVIYSIIELVCFLSNMSKFLEPKGGFLFFASQRSIKTGRAIRKLSSLVLTATNLGLLIAMSVLFWGSYSEIRRCMPSLAQYGQAMLIFLWIDMAVHLVLAAIFLVIIIRHACIPAIHISFVQFLNV